MPNLPNLSNSRSFLASPSPYNPSNGGDSYRELIRENIHNTPRNKENGGYPGRSIDLNLGRENTFRTVSRFNNHNQNLIGDLEKDGDLTSRSNLKSGRNRKLVFYNNKNSDNNNNNNLNMENENQENIDFKNSDNNTNDSSENSYTSRRKRFEDNNFNQSVNNFSNDGNVKFTERLKTARGRDSARTPVVTPRKIFQNDSNSNSNKKAPLQNRNGDPNDDEIFPGINTNFESPRHNSRPQKSARNGRNALSFDNSNNNHSNERSPQGNNNDDYISMRSNSKINLRDDVDSPPVPMPRKRDVSTKLLPNETNDFRIKRVTSSKMNMGQQRSSYLPSTPRLPSGIKQQSDHNNNQLNNGPDMERRNRLDYTQKLISSQLENVVTPRIKGEQFDTDNAEDLFSKSRRREQSSHGQRRGRIEIGLEPKLEPKNNNKSRITFD